MFGLKLKGILPHICGGATIIFIASCHSENLGTADSGLFTLMNEKHTEVSFKNNLEYTEEFNTYTYRNFYNGAGVGIGDINNDDLPDIYFCSNQAGNKLYLNKGNFVFEDITDKAGVGCNGAWSTGVGMADVNGDGWLDIFVCKSGKPDVPNRHNQLFINNGDLTFTDKSTDYGIDDKGLSTHASFFDYDKDGDLDFYLLNNSFQSVTEFDIKAGQREIRDSLGANKLYRNDGDHFTDVTAEAGIFSSKIGFGLGVSVGDVNRDGWPDMYVSNDFFERDYLYINNCNGTFSEVLERQMNEISLGAMGADIGDLNNDGWPEIFATEMTPEDNARRKTKAVFDDWVRYKMKLHEGYYRQFARNVLQRNNGNNTFSEIGRFSGVSTTDWSWGALIMDLDNDGWKDIFVANGIFKDLLDRDFLDFYSDPALMRAMIRTEEQAILKVIDMIPSVKIANYAFRNNHDLTFSNHADEWGLGTPSFSNGAAYGDLDNDGDPDLVINNVNMPAFIYRNESDSKKESNFINITLRSSGKNTSAIGSEVTVYCGDTLLYQELYPQRGFKSSMDTRLNFGLGFCRHVDSVIIIWPDNRFTKLSNLKSNQFIQIADSSAQSHAPMPITRFSLLSAEASAKEGITDHRSLCTPLKPSPSLFTRHSSLFSYLHHENDFTDFERDLLLHRQISDEGPHMAVADVNNDGRQDVFICGSKDSPGTLFVQNSDGSFSRSGQPAFESDKQCEDTDCAFFDADGDGDQDLYVASGGNEYPASSSLLRDRLYINNGKGLFSRSKQFLPGPSYESTSCLEAADYDGDGDMDLFVGIRLIPFAYGLPAKGYLLENDGKGNFKNVSSSKAPMLKNIGMITDMKWADVDNDNDADMIICGDWMPIKILINDMGVFSDKSGEYGLTNTGGWWNTLETCDLNGDGYMDFVAGNHGLNSFYKASPERPVTLYVNDFDLNGSVEQIICSYNGDTAYPVIMKDILMRQIPSLASKYPKYSDFQDQTINDMFSKEVLDRSVVLKANVLQSSAFINSGRGSFEMMALPDEAQYFPVYAIHAGDFDGDGYIDILLGGNQDVGRPETGIYHAGYGLELRGTGNNNWEPLPSSVTGININGQVRDIISLGVKGVNVVIFTQNNDSVKFYKYESDE